MIGQKAVRLHEAQGNKPRFTFNRRQASRNESQLVPYRCGFAYQEALESTIHCGLLNQINVESLSLAMLSVEPIKPSSNFTPKWHVQG